MTTRSDLTARTLVCGGRNYSDRERVYHFLDHLSPKTVIEGAATGADTMAGDWAREHNVECLEFKADWDMHGKSAGPIRNQQMIDEGKPTLVVAFPGGKGTADMLARARKHNIPIIEVLNGKG